MNCQKMDLIEGDLPRSGRCEKGKTWLFCYSLPALFKQDQYVMYYVSI